jgi:predicted nucleic acid-binding protein
VSFLLDTNVISETRRKRPDPRALSWLRRSDPAALHISALTLGEISKGVAKHSRHDKTQAAALRHWLDTIRMVYAERIVPIDAEIAETWGRLAAKRPLPVVDGLLAATALVRGMTLVTRNIGDVADTGVTVVDPWSAR